MKTKISNPITWEELTNVLDYYPDAGIFIWKEKRSQNTEKGSIAGSTTSHGYRNITLGNRQYRAHILAWLYSFKEWPENQIDHINRIRSDNRLDNLREVTASQNSINKNIPNPTASGYTGVYIRAGKYRAVVRHLGKNTSIGTYSTAEEANKAVISYKQNNNLIL